MDTDVVVRAQGGDQAAFTQLATEGARRMNALAVGILRDRRPRRGRGPAGAAQHLEGPAPAARPRPLRIVDLQAAGACLLRRVAQAQAADGRGLRRQAPRAGRRGRHQERGRSRPARARLRAPVARPSRRGRHASLPRYASRGRGQRAGHPCRDGPLALPPCHGLPSLRARGRRSATAAAYRPRDQS